MEAIKILDKKYDDWVDAVIEALYSVMLGVMVDEELKKEPIVVHGEVIKLPEIVDVDDTGGDNQNE